MSSVCFIVQSLSYSCFPKGVVTPQVSIAQGYSGNPGTLPGMQRGIPFKKSRQVEHQFLKGRELRLRNKTVSTIFKSVSR